MQFGGLILHRETYDGDTIKCLVDLGFHTRLQLAIRLDGIDTPEIRTRDELHKAAGLHARDAAQAWLQAAPEPLWFRSTAKPKYAGRAIGVILDAEGGSLSDYLLEHGYGQPYEGGSRSWTEEQLRIVLSAR